MRLVLLLLIPVAIQVIFANANFTAGVKLRHLQKSRNALVEATVKIIQDFYTKTTSCLNFIASVSKKGGESVANELMADIVRGIGESVAVTLETDRNIHKQKKRKKEYCLLFVDSYEGFSRIFKRMSSDVFELQGYFLIIFTQPHPHIDKESKKIFEDLWSRFITNANILHMAKGTTFIFTYFPYTQFYCEQVHPTLLNVFHPEKGFAYPLRPHFPNKMKNLFKCPIKVSTYEIPPFMLFAKNATGHVRNWGFDAIFLWALGVEMNMGIEKIFTHQLRWKNSSAVGANKRALDMTINKEVNFSIGFLTSSRYKNLLMTPTYSYYTTNLVWVIGSKEPLTPLQIFSKPFDSAVWVAISGVFIVSLIVIWVIKCQDREVRNFVFGRGINSPILNMINICLGGAMPRLPMRNFARFLLTNLIIYTMILRGAYQGSLFKFMRMENMTQNVQEMKELLIGNFTFFALEQLMEHIESPHLRQLTVPLNLKTFEDFRVKMEQGGRKMALLASEDHVAYWNKEGRPTTFLNTCPEKLATVNVCIYLPKSSCLTAEINRRIFQFTASGLMDVFMYQTIDLSYLKQKNYKEDPRQLNVNQLAGGFFFLSYGTLLSIFVFMCEVFIGSMRKFWVKWRDI